MNQLKKIIAMTLVVMMLVTSNTSIVTVIAKEATKTNETNVSVASADETKVSETNATEIKEVELPYYVETTKEDDKVKHIKRLEEEENEYMAVFENEDGSITAYSYLEPIKYKDSKGDLVDYDPRMQEVKNQDKKDSGYLYEITSSSLSIMVPGDLVSNKYITLEKDKYKIDFKPISIKDNQNEKIEEPTVTPELTSTPEITSTPEVSVTPEATEMPEITDEPEVTTTPELSVTPEVTVTPEITVTPEPSVTPEITATPESTVTPEITNTPEPTAEESGESGEVKQTIKTEKIDNKYKVNENKNEKDKDKYDSVSYLSTDSDAIEYRYSTLNTGIKEEIILTEIPKSNVFQFEYKFKGLIPKLCEDGRVLLLDDETKEEVGAMDSMFMYDSFKGEQSEEDGHYSENIQLSIEEVNKNKYIFTVTLDKEYLEDEDTVYPVIVDPTIVLDDYPQVRDVYVASSFPYTSYYNTTLLLLGRGYTSGACRSLFRPYIPSGTVYSGYEVTSAVFNTYNYSPYTSNAWIYLYRITQDWSHSSTKWYNQPAHDTSTYIDAQNFNHRGSYNFDITDLAQDWQKYANDPSQGYPNYGFLLRAQTESGGIFREIYTANYTAPHSSITITYTTSDTKAPNNITSVTAVAAEDIDNNGKAKITVSWPETTDNPSWHNTGVQKYRVLLKDSNGYYYNSNGTKTSAWTCEEVTHNGVTSVYSLEYVNLPDNTTYEACVRACDNASTPNWSDYKYSSSIVVGDMLEITVSISPTDWTYDTTPTLTWTDAVNTDSIYYCIDSGT